MDNFTLYKEEFLNYKNPGESIKKGYQTLFKKIHPLEKKLNKDLKDFDKNELMQVLDLMKSKSYNAINTKWSLLKIYLQTYANESVESITRRDINKYIQKDENADRFISRSDLEEKVSNLTNPSDRLLLLLLFEGIMGSNYQDLLHIKKCDLDLDNNIIKVKNKNIKVSDFTKGLIEKSLSELEYYKDITCSNLCPSNSYSLNEKSEYLFKTKPTVRTNNGLNPLGVEGLKSKLSKMLNSLGLEHVTGQSLFFSGLIEKILQYEMETKYEITISEIKEFVKNLGVEKIQAQNLRESYQIYKNKYKCN